MKKLSFINKVIFFLNAVFATLLLLSYVLPLFPPKVFSVFSVLSLGVPFLIIINTLFFLYWLFKLKKQMLLSFLVLTIGYFSFGSFYKFSNTKNETKSNLSVMNYNVRLFNLYKWIAADSIPKKITQFVKQQSPDVVCFQEYSLNSSLNFSDTFAYKYEKLSGNKNKYGQAIFSKYPIINSGSVAFPNTSNNAIFIDIVKQTDTIRVYNLHLQSLKINTETESLSKENSERLFKQIGQTFKMQQFQTELFLLHKKSCKYKTIICGDLNNTAFSYVYKAIKDNMQDAFLQAGNGFGRTYDFKFFPVRIDFIFADNQFSVTSFKTYKKQYSDHFPIMAKLFTN